MSGLPAPSAGPTDRGIDRWIHGLVRGAFFGVVFVVPFESLMLLLVMAFLFVLSGAVALGRDRPGGILIDLLGVAASFVQAVRLVMDVIAV